MWTTFLALTLCATFPSEDDRRPTEAQLRRDHALLAGVWQYTEYLDNGETLGMQLIRTRYARDGRLSVANRVFQTVNPETGDVSLRAYRINPATTPRQIDFTTEDDQIQKGIYRFEGDDLLICYSKDPSAARPPDFTSEFGSNRVFYRLRIASHDDVAPPKLDQPPTIPAAAVEPQAQPPSTTPTPTPTPEQLRREHELLVGVWRLTSMNSEGQSLGTQLISRHTAVGGRISVGKRAIEFVEPDSHHARVLTYRINPAADPKQLDIVNEDAEMFRGIYKFEQDTLIVCLNHQDNGERPTDFDAKAGPKRMLMSLALIDSEPPAAPHIEAQPSQPAGRDVNELARAKPDQPAHSADRSGPGDPLYLDAAMTTVAAPLPPRRPTEAELRSAHTLLAGTWEIESVVDDGQTYSSNLIRQKVAQDGQMVVGDRSMRVITPESGERRISSFKINPTASPRQIDVISSLDQLMPGIYQLDGDELRICLHRGADGVRPTSFDAPAGSNNLLLRLRMVEDEAPAAEAPHEPKPEPPSPEQLKAEREERIRNMLIGSWVTQDKDGTVTTVLRPDGTFITTRQWDKIRLFKGETSTSSGRWSYGQGLVRADVRSSTDRKLVGRTYTARVQTIGEQTMVATDFLGQLRDYRKLR